MNNYTDSYTSPSFSLRNRLARIIWSVFYLLFFKPSPTPLFGWRAFILKMFGAKVGHGAHIYPRVKIWAPWNLIVGEESGVANDVILYSQDKITLGYRAIVSQHSYLCAGSHDYTRRGHPLVTAPIVVGDYAWIAANCFVHPGRVIGSGAVIGACSVVTKDVPEWTVCSGNPCKPIKPRKFVD